MKETAIIILAAGKGTRMFSKTPKVLHKVGGNSMIYHVIDSALSTNPRPSKIITVLNDKMQMVRDKISDVCSVAIQKEQKGTADAVKSALPHLKGFKGNVVILYADTPLITPNTIQKLLETLTSDVAVSVLGFIPDDPAQYGRLVLDGENNLKRIIEFNDANDEERKIRLCNSGIIAIKGSLLSTLLDSISNNNKKNEFYLTDLIAIANDLGHKCDFVTGDASEVSGVNNRLQLSQVEEIYQNRLRESVMLNGVTLIDPKSVYFSYDMKMGRDVIIHPNVYFGEGVIIEDNVEIKPYSHIEGASIGANSVVGPFARLRPGSDLEENVKIGNFVEVKNSTLEKGVKVNHLSYVGDAYIGKNSNIGAGTITCNYDGFAKYQTKIGKEVFIGSNTALIAPVNIGDGSMVAAGSTITNDVDSEALAIARSKQIEKAKGSSIFRDEKISNKKSNKDN